MKIVSFKKAKSKEQIPLYKPAQTTKPKNLIEEKDYVSAWQGIELIIEDILNRFKVGRKACIEFGVEFGYSTVVLSNFFDKVTGIDTFEGDIHTVHKGNHFEITRQRLSVFPNIHLIQSDYKDWIKHDTNRYDFAHVDIVHTYEDTLECGLWAARHSYCTVFHDTESFPGVRTAVVHIAVMTRKRLFNYPHANGLGIIVGK